MGYRGSESIWISELTRGCQELSVLEAEGNLTGEKWGKCPIVTGPEAPHILGIDCLRRGYFKDLKKYQWTFSVTTVNTEKIKQLSTPPGLLEHPFLVGLLQGEEQLVPIATKRVVPRSTAVSHKPRFPGSLHELIHQLEGQGGISKTHSPCNSPLWAVQKSDGEWRLA